MSSKMIRKGKKNRINSGKPKKISILGIFNGQFPKNIRRIPEKRTENFLKHGEF